MCSAVQRHQSPERPILRQICSLMFLKIQRRLVIVNVLLPSCARPPRWSPPVLWGEVRRWLTLTHKTFTTTQPLYFHGLVSLQHSLIVCCRSYSATFVISVTNNLLFRSICFTITVRNIGRARSIFSKSQPYSEDGSSDAAFRCQYCSILC